MTRSESAVQQPERSARTVFALFVGPAASVLAAGLAFLLYGYSAAPGLTWANYGADGGDLLVAAVTNGTPHPTGYPLYTLLLQGWLALLGALLPGSDIAWRGNLFSGFAAALSVGLTVLVVRHLWREDEKSQSPAQPPAQSTGLLPAMLAGAAWMIAPLLWGQAVITEVYSLHALLFVALFWALAVYRPRQPLARALLLGGLLGLGAAHHVTLGLLVPGVLYWLWRDEDRPLRSLSFWLWIAIGLLPGLLLYSRSVFVSPLAPVNWGGNGSLGDIWWLVSGAAYRRYLFALPAGLLLSKAGQWALVITIQLTPIGLGVCLAGLYRWDRLAGRLRTLSLLWIVPVSLYAITYHTADSEIYLLPVVWMMAIWLPFGVRELTDWINTQRPGLRWEQAVLGGSLAALLVLGAVRLPSLSLRHDEEARHFVADAVRVIEPKSVVFSSADAETFALWYAAWGSGELLDVAPGSALVNVALLQFEWYRALLVRLYPDLAGVDAGDAAGILQANVGRRPIFFSEVIAPATAEKLKQAGSLWRYTP